MSVIELLDILIKHNITLKKNKNALEYQAPTGVMTNDILELIKTHKQALLNLSNQQLEPDGIQAIPIKLWPRDTPAPASLCQQRLLFLQQLESDQDHSHNIPWNLHLKGALDVNVLTKTLNIIIARHESLRTRFDYFKGKNVQVINNTLSLDIPVINVDKHSITSHLRNHASRVFDLNNGPLLNLSILHLSANEHILLFNIHHIVADGWSLSIVFDELTTLYSANINHRVVTLNKLNVQYAEYAVWQKNMLRSATAQRQLHYWQQQLSKIPPLLALPYDYARQRYQSFKGNNVEFQLSTALHTSLTAFSHTEGVTLFTSLLTGFYILLYRYSNQPDICIGTPVANRQLQAFNPVVGFFVNTLALRINLAPTNNIRALVQQVKVATIGAFSNQDLPFDRIVEEINPERSTSYSPLFQNMFCLQNTTKEKFEFANIQATYLKSPTSSTKFDLTLTITECEHGMNAEFEYNADLYKQSTIISLCNHYQNILNCIVNNPEQNIAEIDFLQQEEKEKLLHFWNSTHVNYVADQCIHQHIEQQVRTTPDAIAIIEGDCFFTFEFINQRSNQLAHYLIELGAGPESIIALFMPRSVNVFIGLLAILKSGAAYLPIDIDHPQNRINYIINNSGASIVLSSVDDKHSMQTNYVTITLSLDHEQHSWNHHSTHNPQPALSLDNLVYIIYTSGSTGKPKAVMLQHGALINHMLWMQHCFTLSQSDKIVQKTPLTFDASVWEWALALSAGSQLILARTDGHLDPDYLTQLISQHQISVFQTTPSLLKTLIASNDIGQLKSLRYLFTGGEYLPIALFDQFNISCSNTILCNLYGTSEAAIDSTFWQYHAEKKLRSSSIGKPISNTEILLLNEKLDLVPIAVEGELFIGGNGVGRGYLNDPILTAQKFVPNPFSNKIGDRLYKTQDIAKYHRDGNIHYIRRKDNQVQIHGVRVELGEIEIQICKHTNITQAAVVYQSTNIDSDNPSAHLHCLCAFVVYKKSSVADIDALLQQLRQQLPEYMIPTAIVNIEKLPVTTTGKIDRRALLQRIKHQHNNTLFTAPKSETEKRLLSFWSDTLCIAAQNISTNDNFFKLGGHSLQISKVLNAATAYFDIELPLRLMFDHPTLQTMSTLIDEKIQEKHTNNSPQHEICQLKCNDSQATELSFSQRRLWFIDQLTVENDTSYNMPRAIKLNGHLNHLAFNQALQHVINRHDSLRTRFVNNKATLVQIIDPTKTITLDVIQIPEQDLENHISLHANTVFDLTNGPLLQLALFQLCASEHVFLMTTHHSISDGWSMAIFDRELSACYQCYINNESPKLDPLPIQYIDFTQWQQSYLKTHHKKLIRYWKNTVAGALLHIDLPMASRYRATNSNEAAITLFSLPRPLSEKFTILCHDHNCTLFAGLLAVFKVLLLRLSGQTDISVGTVTACRPQQTFEKLIGCFANTLILRDRIEIANTSFIDLIKQVQVTSTQAISHEALPFDSIIDLINKSEPTKQSQSLQTFFDLQYNTSAQLNLAGIVATEIASYPTAAKFDLSLSIQILPMSEIQCAFEYKKNVFSADSIQQFSEIFKLIFDDATTNPTKNVNLLNVLTTTNRRKIFVDWNQTRVKNNHERPIHQLFEEQAQIRPDATAIVYQNQFITYRQLNQSSDNLAFYLIQKKLVVESAIGICLERSPLLLIAMLGVLKAGAAYVPISTQTPIKGLSNLCSNTSISLVLSQYSMINKLEQLMDLEKIFDLDKINLRLRNRELSVQHSPLDPNNLAYIIHTSGTTGKAKGVAITHSNLTNLASWHQRQFNVAIDAKITTVADIGFDAMGFEVWPCLISGASLHLPPPDIHLKPIDFISWITQHKITHSFAPTPLAKLLVANNWPKQSNLAYLFTGGDTLTLSTKHRQPFQFINTYGPSEATIVSTTSIVSSPPADAASTEYELPSIGKAIDNYQVYILDQALNPVPIGVVGELYIAGAGVARGYFNNPLLTAEKFLPDPFNNQIGSRCYRSGDMAKFRHNGDIEFVGRRDQQFNLRGVRIEAGEIESNIIQHPLIESCATVVVNGPFGDDYLIAYFTSSKKNTATLPADFSATMRTFLADKLPKAVTPNVFIYLKSLPLTTNGKIDKNTLKKRDIEQLLAKEDTVKKTIAEKSLEKIWIDVLQLSSHGLNRLDDFFSLGGHSLLAIMLISKIEEHMQITIKLIDVFDNSTLQSLARLINTRRINDLTPDKTLIISEKNTPLILNPELAQANAYPQSFAQQRLWSIHQQHKHNDSSYNISNTFRLLGHLNIHALTLSLNTITQRHSSLRTTFANIDTIDVQRVTNHEYRSLTVVNIATNDLNCYLENNSRIIFDLQNGPVFNFRLLQHAPKDHSLLLNVHHIVCDGWSVAIILKELSSLYNAFSTGNSPNLVALPKNYVDYTHWQLHPLQRGKLAQQLEYWKKQLKAAPEVLTLPTDRKKSLLSTSKGGVEDSLFSPQLTQQLTSLSQQQGCTLFMTLLTAFSILLARYSGQNDICVGTPVANRLHANVETMVGLFVNIVVLRTTFSLDNSVSELLQQVKSTALTAFSNQDAPFEQVVRAVDPKRSSLYSPLFQVLFSMHNTPAAPFTLTGLNTALLASPVNTTLYDLSMNLIETKQGISLALQYDSDIYDRSTIKTLINHYHNVVKIMLENPNTRVSNISELTKTDIYNSVQRWNNTDYSITDTHTIYQYFETQVTITPDAIAITDNNTHLTFNQLNKQSNKLARYLIEQKIAPDITVGICAERSIEQIVGLIAIGKAGGAYVPIDPQFPIQRINYILNNSQCALVLTQKTLRHTLLDNCPTPILCLDHIQTITANYTDTNTAPNTSLKNLITIIYTSGSTGQPKGVMTTHSAFRNHMAWMKKTFLLSSNDKFLHKTPLVFDAAGWEWAMPLIIGAQLMLADNNAHRAPEQLLTIIKKYRVDVLQVVPALLNLLLSKPESSLQTLRYLFTGGETLSKSLSDKFQLQTNNQVPIYNLYGPTEATIDSSYHRVSDTEHAISVPIGKPISNTQLYILDKHLNPVATGVIGELFIGGLGLARGYINDPAKTAEHFIPNNFSNENGARLYKTGDCARHNHNGNIEFIGRIDHQVKVRGLRIELQEIEACLLLDHRIKETAVVVNKTNNNEQITAYIVTTNHTDINRESLLATLYDTLPTHMIPTALHFLKQLPLTSSGKIDRLLLSNRKNMLSKKNSTHNNITSHITLTEKMLISIWLNTLSIDTQSITVNSDFFDLGGHSLLATKIINKVNQTFSVTTSIRDLLAAPTVAKFSALIDRAVNNKDNHSAEVIVKRGATKAPLSLQQQRFWLNNHVPDYMDNMLSAFKLSGQLQLDVLKNALALIVERHQSLRTQFCNTNSIFSQSVSNSSAFDFSSIECSNTNLQTTLSTIARAPINVLSDRLFAITVIKLANTQHILVIKLHHIIADGHSLEIILHELSTIYSGLITQQTTTLAPPTHYFDYAYWQREKQKAGFYGINYDYWRWQLDGVNLKYYFWNNSADATPKPMSLKFSIPIELKIDLVAMSKKNGVTLFTTLISAFALLIAKHSDNDNICIAFDQANRHMLETENTVGLFANTIILRTHPKLYCTIERLLESTQSTILLAIEHQDILYSDLFNLLNHNHHTSETALCPFAFVLQQDDACALTLNDITTSPVSIDNLDYKADLVMQVKNSETIMSIDIHYQNEAFSTTFIQNMANGYVAILKHMTTSATLNISELLN